MANNIVINQKQRNQAILEFGLMYLMSVLLFGYVIFSFVIKQKEADLLKKQWINEESQAGIANNIISQTNTIFEIIKKTYSEENPYPINEEVTATNQLDTLLDNASSMNISFNQLNLKHIRESLNLYKSMSNLLKASKEKVMEKDREIQRLNSTIDGLNAKLLVHCP